MFIEEVIFARLDPVANGQLYAGVAPKEAQAPYAVYSVGGGQQGMTFGGVEGLQRVQVQVDCWADGQLDALGLARAVFQEVTRRGGQGFGCGGVLRLGNEQDPETGLWVVRWEYTLIDEG